MISIKDLESIGISKESLMTYYKFHKIDIDSEFITILDDSLYSDFLFKSINNQDVFLSIVMQIDNYELLNLYMTYYSILFTDLNDALKYITKITNLDNNTLILYNVLIGKKEDYFNDIENYEGLNNVIKIINDNFKSGRFKLCTDLFDIILYYDDSLFIRVLKELCNKKDDNISYIVSPRVYRNPLILYNYRKFERSLLFYIQTGLLDRALEINKELRNIYIEQNTLIFDIIHVFLIRINSLIKNKRMISSRKELGVFGDTYSVIFALLNANDFYRVREVINSEYKNDEVRMDFLILHSLSEMMKIYLDKNSQLINKEISLNTFGTNTVEDVIGKYELSSISFEMLKDFEDISDQENYYAGDLNYFEEYEMLLVIGDYEGALTAIKRFEFKMHSLGVKVNFDYIEKDLEIRILNSKGISAEEYERLIHLGNKAYLDSDYRSAIKYFDDALNYAKKINPVILAKIGDSYYRDGDIDIALMHFRDAYNEFMYPNDLLTFIELLYQVEDFQTLLKVADKYEEYYNGENPKIHYYKSIAYLHLNLYEIALEEIEMTELIIQEMYGITYEFKYEKDIINNLNNGKKVSFYNMDNYIDFNLSYEEKEMREKIKTLSDISSNTVELVLEDAKGRNEPKEVIHYLSMLIKVLISDNKISDAKKVYDFSIKYIDDANITDEKKNEFTLSLKNYRNL